MLRRRLSHPPRPRCRRFSPRSYSRNFYPLSLLSQFDPFFLSSLRSILSLFYLFCFFSLFYHSLYTPRSSQPVSLHGEATNTGLIVNEKSLHFRVQILVQPPRRSRASYPLPFQPLLPILCLLVCTNSVEIPLDRCRSFSSRLPVQLTLWIIVRRECNLVATVFPPRHDPWLLAHRLRLDTTIEFFRP